MNYYCCICLLHLVAVGAGGVEVGSSPCWWWAVRGLILRRLPVAVVVVLSVVGSSRPAGGGVPILRTWWAPSACLSWWTSPCCWSCCCSIWSAARPPSVGWASPWCPSRWWSPRWGGDWHWSLRGTDFCSPLPLYPLCILSSLCSPLYPCGRNKRQGLDPFIFSIKGSWHIHKWHGTFYYCDTTV